MSNGYLNEFAFCQVINKKYVCQLSEKYIEVLERLFGKNLYPGSTIYCWKACRTEKADIVIRIGQVRKYISIKSGKNNSIHVETLEQFFEFLKSKGCSEELLNIYKEYHYGFNEKGERISGKEYQELHQEELAKLNEFLNQDEMLESIFPRFLLIGNSPDANQVDGFIYGTPNNFMFAKSEQLKHYLFSQKDDITAPHFCSLILQPWARNLNYNPQYEYRRKFVQVKWYRLEEVFENLEKLHNIYK